MLLAKAFRLPFYFPCGKMKRSSPPASSSFFFFFVFFFCRSLLAPRSIFRDGVPHAPALAS